MKRLKLKNGWFYLVVILKCFKSKVGFCSTLVLLVYFLICVHWRKSKWGVKRVWQSNENFQILRSEGQFILYNLFICQDRFNKTTGWFRHGGKSWDPWVQVLPSLATLLACGYFFKKNTSSFISVIYLVIQMEKITCCIQ